MKAVNSFYLKIIAIITMLIDHTAAVLIPSNTALWLAMRYIGRISFPIFVFLLVEGFCHTRNARKYLMRMGAFALISEVPFDLAFYGKILEFKHQNIFFTLFLGLLCLLLMKEAKTRFEKNTFAVNVLNILLILGFCVAAEYLRTDYGAAGIVLIVAFYLFRGNRLLSTGALLLVSISINRIQTFAILAMLPIFLYNGQRGRNIKYAFYIFYPAHLLILALLKIYL